MKQRLTPIFLLSFFLAVYFLMHYYVFLRIAGWLDISNPLDAMYIMLALFVSFPVFSVAERFIDSVIVRILYYLSSVWLGQLFFLFLITLFFDMLVFLFSFRGFSLTDTARFRIALSAVIISSLVVLYGIISARRISVVHVTIPVRNFPKTLSKLVVVQLSDIHAGAINGPSFVKENVKIANSFHPDVVVITGDLFDGTCVHSEEKMRSLVRPLKGLKARFASFFVTGNHERYVGADLTSRIVSSLGITPLRNSAVSVRGIVFAGIDNPPEEMRRGIPELSRLDISEESPLILLYHLPLGIEDAMKKGVSLQLSGHTHGGQVFPFGVAEKLFFPCVAGLFRKENFFLYVSRGSGTWGPPMRVLSPPEITVFKLVPKN